MPLTRLKEEYLEQDGVRFLMEDGAGSTVACKMSHEALRDMPTACTFQVPTAHTAS
jgi:hypothetical protein